MTDKHSQKEATVDAQPQEKAPAQNEDDQSTEPYSQHGENNTNSNSVTGRDKGNPHTVDGKSSTSVKETKAASKKSHSVSRSAKSAKKETRSTQRSVKSQHISSRNEAKEPSVKPPHSSKTKKSSSSCRSSVALRAKKAALLAESAGMKKKEEIEKQMLELQHKAKRVELETEIDKLEAEQRVIEEEEDEETGSSEDEASTSYSEDKEHRIADWVQEAAQNTQAEIEREPERPGSEPVAEKLWKGAVAVNPGSRVVEEKPESDAAVEKIGATKMPQKPFEPWDTEMRTRKTDMAQVSLNPMATEFNPVTLSSEKASSVGLQDMVHALTMPKVEMMTFEGDPIRFWTFMKAFDNTVGNYRIDDNAKLARLMQYCKGRAYRVIESCAAMPTGGYQRARQLLTERFGDQYSISSSWITRVTTSTKINNETLQDFSDELVTFRETMYAIDCQCEINQQVLVRIAEKLPIYLQHKWRHQASKIRREKNARLGIDDLVSFIQIAAKEISDPVFGDLGASRRSRDVETTKQAPVKKGFHGAIAGKEGVKTKAAQSPDTGQTRENKPCVACHESSCNSLFRCEAFKALTPAKRFEMAQTNHLCFNCLKTGHSTVSCKAESTCAAPGCRLKHTKFLHVPTQRDTTTSKTQSMKQQGQTKPEQKTEVTCSQVSSAAPREAGRRVALPVVQVNVKAENGMQTRTFALLDSGSTNSFCSTSLVRRLKSQGQGATMSLRTLDSMSDRVHTSVHALEVSDADQQNRTVLGRVFETENPIPVPQDCIVDKHEVEKWDHLRGISMPELTDGKVELLIGQDYPEVLMPLETRGGEDSVKPAPFAVRTLLGWTINGPIGGQTGLVHTASVHVTVNSTLEDQVERFWKIEGNQMTASKGLSLEDKKALDVMKATTCKEEGHYSIAIPFRDDTVLPNNKALAVSRLKGLSKKLERNPTLKKAYDEGMTKLIEKGYAEKVTNEPSRGKEWYIPHHPVINPEKNTKVRIVFDCAAKYEGVALNERVLPGPDLTNGLIGILMRFRQYPVAISADVEAMFHQVRVPEEDRDALRFLWWPGGDMTKEPDVYRMTVHLFGGSWSPSVCSYALQQTARDHEDEFDRDVVDTVLREFYVDDCLTSTTAETEAKKLVTQLPQLLSKGGFRLHKWLSNHRDVLAAVPESERATSIQDLNFQALPVERILGVLWDVNADTFTYKMRKTSKPMTRRGLLGSVCSVYDPTGLVAPFTIRGRMLVQELAKNGMTWDEPLEGELLRKWQNWLDELEMIHRIQIPRCVQPANFGSLVAAELHHFSDASVAAYGAASFLRLVDDREQVQCSLLFARSRVSPLKQVTIPRLELAAAALSVQQDEMLRRELTIQLDPHSYYWTDSQIVLAYIRNTKKRFHTYVANRLSVIHSGSSPEDWGYVRSEDNPADDISRGLRMQELINCERWFQGPPFLQDVNVQTEQEVPEVTLDDDSEVKQTRGTRITACPTVTEDVTSDLIQKHSSWTKLRRIFAWLLRYRTNLLAKTKGQQSVTGRLQVQELNAAEEVIVRHVQKQTYDEEVGRLGSNSNVKKSSRLYKLDPTLDANGLLVCRNRARSQGGPVGPAILPKEHHISRLLVVHYHEAAGHAGRGTTACEVRQKYWIVGLKSLTRQVIGDCRLCRRTHSHPMQQRMGNLPKERFDADEPPFTHVGTDCFGPFKTKIGRKQYKRYGCIFTCMTSRAIHLEVLDTMDTASFVNALQRFMSRRGTPKTMWSDNGTNFTGAEHELSDSLKQLNTDQIDTFLSNRLVQWKFNPAGASHMGGAWERLIRSIRKTLQSVMVEQVTTDDNLHTLLCLTENIINSRPLTALSDDPNDKEPLTPNHLLMQRPAAQIPLGVFNRKDCYSRRRWRSVQYLADLFWHRWVREYLPQIQIRPKWKEEKSNLLAGDIVLVVDYNMPRNQWRLGRVSSVTEGSDGLVRSAVVQTSTSSITRPIHKLCYLEGSAEK